MKRVFFSVLLLLSGCSLAKGERCLSDLEYDALKGAFGQRDQAIKELASKLEALFKVYQDLVKAQSK